MTHLLENKIILIVDDEEDIRELIASELLRHKCRIHEASGGEEALRLMEKIEVDLVIADLRMPHGDGLKMLEKIRARNAEKPPVVLISGGSMDIPTHELYQKGAALLVQKPFQLRTMVEDVSRVLCPLESKWERRHPRVAVNRELVIHYALETLPPERTGQLVNLGRGGMFLALRLDELPRVGDKLSFKVHFNRGQLTLIQGVGVVRWIREKKAPGAASGCGIEFLELDQESREQVVQVIKLLKGSPFIPSS